MLQAKQSDWHWQWQEYADDSLFLFTEWIAPHTLETFRDKDVVDCGCGGGQHAAFAFNYFSFSALRAFPKCLISRGRFGRDQA